MIRSSIGHQRGRALLGFIVGLVVGLSVAVAVALYITNAPVPFINKVRPASENINPGAGGQLPDPNKPLQAPPRGPDVTTIPPPKLDAATDPKAAPPPPEKGVTPVPDDGTRYATRALRQHRGCQSHAQNDDRQRHRGAVDQGPLKVAAGRCGLTRTERLSSTAVAMPL